MNCPACQSSLIRKNGHHRGKQRYQCKNCDRQFLESITTRGYSNELKEHCLKMYVNGMGFRGIERVTGVHHTTIIGWVKQVASALPSTPQSEEIPEITQVDELQTFVGQKKNKIWVWTAVDKHRAGILAWVIGDRSSETFVHLWKILRAWDSFWYVTDGYAVYPCFIDSSAHVVSKIYMTRVEGENTRLRHYERSFTS